MHEVRVLRVIETTMLDEQRRVVSGLRMEFTVGEHGPFAETFPKEGFDAMAARRKLDEFADKLRQVTGR